MTTTTFTIEDALEIQKEQVLRWGKVLSDKAYNMLCLGIMRKNAKGYKSASDVFRGVDIDMYIHNEIMNKL